MTLPDDAPRPGPSWPERSTVLIVDDEPMNIRLLEKILAPMEGVDVVSTMYAREAKPLFEVHRPDLVLLDLHMPELDGLDVLRLISDVVAPDDFVPVMVLTADVARESRHDVLAAGAHDFLVKPLDASEVTLRVANALHTRALHVIVERNRGELARRVHDLEEDAETERLRVAGEIRHLREVIDGPQLEMVYQPIVELRGRETTGFEALSRFLATPTRPPDQWFAEAARHSLRGELEFLAVSLALHGLRRITNDQFLSINVAPEIMVTSDFRTSLDAQCSDLSRIVFELTEHSRVDEYAPLLETMSEFRGRGARFAVDDAGSGFASFSHVLKLQPEWIKLDIEFTRGIDHDPARRAIAAALVQFASEVGSNVIAEGIENEGEFETLIDIGVPYGQGYFLARPGPLSE